MENLSNNQELISRWSAPLFSWPLRLIQWWYGKEKLDASHSQGLRGYSNEYMCGTCTSSRQMKQLTTVNMAVTDRVNLVLGFTVSLLEESCSDLVSSAWKRGNKNTSKKLIRECYYILYLGGQKFVSLSQREHFSQLGERSEFALSNNINETS